MNIIYLHDNVFWCYRDIFVYIDGTPSLGQEPCLKLYPVHFTNFETWFFEYPNSNKATLYKTHIKIIFTF